MKKITLEIDGMMCGMCESHMNDAVRKHFTVKKVTSSHSKGETIILTEEEISQTAIEAAIAPTGYVLMSMKTEPYEKKRWFSRG